MRFLLWLLELLGHLVFGRDRSGAGRAGAGERGERGAVIIEFPAGWAAEHENRIQAGDWPEGDEPEQPPARHLSVVS